MQIPLNQFEQYIDETILKRGLAYFKDGSVNEPEEISPGCYEAIVGGSEDYLVQLKIVKDSITEYSCDCPYDLGPICKHVAAVIFYLQQEFLDIKPKTPTNKTPRIKSVVKAPKAKTVVQQVDEILEKVSHEELKQFIREKTEHNPPLRNIFLSSFAPKNSSESKELYAKQVKAILREAEGRKGFIYYNNTRRLSNNVHEILMSAEKHIEKKNFKSAFFICTAVMEQMTPALQYADDSNGDIGGTIDSAFESLCTIANEAVPEELRMQLFDYCITSFEKKIYDDWDWHLGMLVVASKIFTTEQEAEKLLFIIDHVNSSEYMIEHAQEIKFEVLRKTKGEQEAEKFLEQNISNPIFRRYFIAASLSKKKFSQAIEAAQAGINQDMQKKPGLAKEWYDWLLKIAQAQNDKEQIVKNARFLYIDNFRNEQDYYQVLKDNVDADKWLAFLEDLISDIKNHKRYPDIYLLTNIFIKEKWWDRLLDLVRQNPSFRYIEEFEKYLSPNYSLELISLYRDAIIKYMKDSVGRNHYQTVCKYLRRMIKLGGRLTADKIISDLRTQYPQRKALMEELNRV